MRASFKNLKTVPHMQQLLQKIFYNATEEITVRR